MSSVTPLPIVMRLKLASVFTCNSCGTKAEGDHFTVERAALPGCYLTLVEISDLARSVPSNHAMPMEWASFPGDVHICPACQAKRQPPINQEK